MRYLVCTGTIYQQKINLDELRILFSPNTSRSPNQNELKKLMVVEEMNAVLLPPLHVNSLLGAGVHIANMLDTESVIIVIDLLEFHASIYQKSSVDDAKNIYIPRFIALYDALFHKGKPFIRTIEDFSIGQAEVKLLSSNAMFN